MLPSTIRRRLAVTTLSLVFLLLASFSTLADNHAVLAQSGAADCTKLCRIPSGNAYVASSTVPQAATGTLSISNLYAADGSNNKKSAFQPGNTIHYVVWINNKSGRTITATVQFLAYWGKSIADTTSAAYIYVQTYQNISVPAGSAGFYVPSTVPVWATPGSYTYQVNVWDQSNTANKSTASTIFWVTGTKYVWNAAGYTVPFFSQYLATDGAKNSDCGPASDAMVLAYLAKISSSLSNGQKIAYVRQTIVNYDGNKYGDTNGLELMDGLTSYNNGTWNGIYAYTIQQNDPAGITPYIQESDIAAAIADNDPAVELINAQAFGRSYTGHWLVVVGFTSDGTSTQVILNDPDNQAARPGYPNWIVGGGYIKVSLSTFGNAIQTVTPDYNIDGIVGYV